MTKIGWFGSPVQILALGVLLSACASMVTHSDQYEGARLGEYKRFAWIGADPLIRPGGEQPPISPLNQRRIQEAIESELRIKGYEKADAATQADFVVSYTVGSREKISAYSYPDIYRGPWAWNYFHNDLNVHTYTEGALAIDVFDGASRQPVWHGWARKQVTGSDVANPAPVISRGVRAILQKFPPRKS